MNPRTKVIEALQHLFLDKGFSITASYDLSVEIANLLEKLKELP